MSLGGSAGRWAERDAGGGWLAAPSDAAPLNSRLEREYLMSADLVSHIEATAAQPVALLWLRGPPGQKSQCPELHRQPGKWRWPIGAFRIQSRVGIGRAVNSSRREVSLRLIPERPSRHAPSTKAATTRAAAT